MSDARTSWEALASAGANRTEFPVWRDYCDRLHQRLLARWLGGARCARALKTDLFDEALGAGLVPALAGHALTVHGLDVALSMAARAAARHPGLLVHVADVRALPTATGAFDLVVSNSTLDHFASNAELQRALDELVRIVRPGGLLLVTLDNPWNPMVALRNRWLRPLMGRGALVPYFTGCTLSRPALARALRARGLRVQRARYLMHAPRVAALHLARRVAAGRAPARALVRVLLWLEWLAWTPLAPVTGHFGAVLARKADA